MECNRDEAVRAKEIAERKFLERDLKGAKKFAKKAQNLFPDLDGISQMLTTLEVYISAEEKIHGESNWYGVLGVTHMADDAMIKKQYRKLALVLHPDKNKCVGADGAFQLVKQAWTLLSDKTKRTEFDQKCVMTTPKTNQVPSTTKNGFHDFAKTAAAAAAAASKPKVPKAHNSKRSGLSPSKKKERKTFWTVCHRCKMQYEYLRMYLNHHLLCPNCHEAYFAMEIEPPSSKASKVSPQTANSQHHQNNNASGTHYGTSDFHRGSNGFEWVPFSEQNGAASAVHAANMVHQAYEKVKKERQKAQAAKRKEEAQRKKNQRTMGAESSAPSNSAKRRRGIEEGSTANPAKKLVKTESGKFQSTITDIKQLLMEKARADIRKHLSRSASATVVGDTTCHQKNVATTDSIPATKMNNRSSGLNLNSEQIENMSVAVQVPDFYDFDKDRTEECFGDNQLWAVYDNEDGMPRNYAMIHNVVSVNPFVVRMSWLRHLNYISLGHASWFRCSFSKTCGEFGIGETKNFSLLKSFSHRVKWNKSTTDAIQIFPQKRDVWALYRNWSPDWNELTADEVIHKYDFVQVLEEYDDEEGIIVVPLVKVAGFKSVFHQHLDPLEIRRIPKEEMGRFSHHAPSHVLTGIEGSKVVKGCLELDPSIIPSEILEAAYNIEEIELMETDEDANLAEEADHVEAVKSDKVEVEGNAEEIEPDKESIDEEVEFVKAVNDGDGNTVPAHMVEGVS